LVLGDIIIGPQKQNESNARVAVLLSTYNGERYLNDLLDSINMQCFRSFHLYIRDDGSSDKSPDLIETYAGANIKKFVKGRNVGVVDSFFDLLGMAGDNYDYYAFCDQDDIWLKDKLSYAVELLNAKSSDIPVLYFSRYELVSSALRHIKYSHTPQKIGFGNAIVQNIVTGCTSVINKRARALILEKKPVKVHMHDWWFYLVISAFGELVFDKRVSIKYRIHDGNVIGSPTSFWHEYKIKIKRLISAKRNPKLPLLSQAEEFFNLYQHQLKECDKKLLNKILYGNSSINRRVRLAFSRKIWRESLLDDLILRASILLNRYWCEDQIQNIFVN
jgi:glycosyltransferase involved in cell wall biosynthesis